MGNESSARFGAASNPETAKIRSQNFRADRRRKFFRAIAKHAFPRKTVPEVRRLTRNRYGERTIYDWIAGRSDAPMAVCMRIIGEIFED